MIEASLPPGVRVTEDGQASLLMTVGSRTARLTGLTGDLRQLLLQLASAPLIPGAHEHGTPLTQLAERRLVRFTCADGPHELMTATGLGGPCSVDFSPGREEDRFRLSRFAYTRNLNGTLVIEVPHRFLRIQILDPGVGSLLADLARGASMTALAQLHPAYDKEMVRETMRFLAGTGVIGLESDQGTLEEDTDPDLAPREFHDVAFHSHTRRGLAGRTVGASFPFLGKIPPTPALKPVSAGPLIRLAQPVVADLERRDPPLVTVMEQRRSLRRYGAGLTIDQVGEFLFRVARVRAVVPQDPAAGLLYEVTNRTYPSGGAAYDLEVYLTAGRCAGPRTRHLPLRARRARPLGRLPGTGPDSGDAGQRPHRGRAGGTTASPDHPGLAVQPAQLEVPGHLLRHDAEERRRPLRGHVPDRHGDGTGAVRARQR